MAGTGRLCRLALRTVVVVCYHTWKIAISHSSCSSWWAPVKLYQAAIRAVLLGLVVPALIIDRDGRGLHDKMAGTVEIQM